MPEAPGSRAKDGRLRRGLGISGVVLVAAAALLGGNVLGLRDRIAGSAAPEARRVAVSPFAAVDARRPAPRSVLRSQPWWQRVTLLRGAGARRTPRLALDPQAIQWRVRWRCRRGRLAVGTAFGKLVDAGCPGTGTQGTTDLRQTALRIAATGPFSLVVDQQVDVPLQEPPLAAMRAPGATVLATGRLGRIDQAGRGRVVVYRLADGRTALRLADFYVTPNVDLELRLSPLPRPRSTREFLSAPSRRIAALPITAGSLNFVLPRSVGLAGQRALVVWCPPQRSAYAAASLRTGG